MKEHWLCRIFGHYFVGKDKDENGEWYLFARDYCIRCGVPQKELLKIGVKRK